MAENFEISIVRWMLAVLSMLFTLAFGLFMITLRRLHLLVPYLPKLALHRVRAQCQSLWRNARDTARAGVTPSFVYEPLSRPAHTRLLFIHPGKDSDQLSLTVEHVSLDDKPEFIAASYTWQMNRIWPGFAVVVLLLIPAILLFLRLVISILCIIFMPEFVSRAWDSVLDRLPVPWMHPIETMCHWLLQERTHHILCNGKTFRVRENLYHFLLELRRQDCTSRYWIDAICINQNDIAERNQQVLLMNTIFTTCRRVIAWLGSCPEYLDNAWAMAQVHFREDTVDPDRATLDLEYTLSRMPLRFLSRAYVLGRSYWSRIWVIQELFLPEDIVFWVGPYQLSPEQLDDIIQMSDPTIMSIAHFAGDTSVSMVDNLLRSRKAFRQQQHMSIPEYLLAAAGHQATDSRDLIYAGLGLLSNPRTDAVTTLQVPTAYDGTLLNAPDYTADLIDVLINCASRLLKDEGLHALSFACNGSSDCHLENQPLPSWVPHITDIAEYTSLSASSGPVFAAGGSATPRISITTERHLVLESGAICFDTVDVVIERLLRKLPEVVFSTLETRPKLYEGTGEHLLSALARTLVADTVDGEQACETGGTTESLVHLLVECLRQQSDTADTSVTNIQKVSPSYIPWNQHLVEFMSWQAESDKAAYQLKKSILEKALAEIGESGSARNGATNKPMQHDGNDGELNTTLHRSAGTSRHDISGSIRHDLVSGSAEPDAATLSKQRFVKWFTGRATDYEKAFEARARDRSFFVTKQGYLGLGSAQLKQGDSIMILAGASMPYAMQSEAVEGQMLYKMRGEVYVHGIMNGEGTKGKLWHPLPITII